MGSVTRRSGLTEGAAGRGRIPRFGSLAPQRLHADTRSGQEPKEHAKRHLAHVIADDVTAALRRGEASEVVLVAPAPVLHALKGSVADDLRRAVVGERAGDLTRLPTAEVFHRLDALHRAG